MIDVTRRIQRYLCAEFAAGAEGLVAINERSKIARQRHASLGVERLGTPQRGAETFVVRVAVPATGAMAARVYLPINFTVAPSLRHCPIRHRETALPVAVSTAAFAPFTPASSCMQPSPTAQRYLGTDRFFRCQQRLTVKECGVRRARREGSTAANSAV